MAEIRLLSHETIDKIAAGEVVERPSSIVKELVENAIDAGAKAVTVEIKDGGISFIRVSDNGCGIEKTEIRKAFLRHATSKITDAGDLIHLRSLGFRGEALSSISAVSLVEMVTKTKDDLTGSRICLEGPQETEFEEVGAPDGTTIIVRNLFFNVPARRKFLKQPATEGGYVADLMEHLALANPDVSFQFIQNNQVKFSTAGNGNLKQVIYKLYGKDAAESLLPIQQEKGGISINGYLGKPSVNRSTRSYELYFLNGRFIRDKIISGAVEEGYKSYVMQHKYPFCVLMIEVEPEKVDVNVHPAKMEVRFSDGPSLYQFIAEAVKAVLDAHEMIPEVILTKEEEKREAEKAVEPFLRHQEKTGQEAAAPAGSATSRDFFIDFDEKETENKSGGSFFAEEETGETPLLAEEGTYQVKENSYQDRAEKQEGRAVSEISREISNAMQMELFEEKIISEPARKKFRILGQVFETYWLIVYEDKLLMVDQHAAHEKVKYESLMKNQREGTVISQNLYPPLVISLSGREQEVLARYKDAFESLGFEWEDFGGNEIRICSAPAELYVNTMKDMFLEVLDELLTGGAYRVQSVEDRIATMACKAAVKGNSLMSLQEAEALLDELLTLDNPYFCPHGRPAIISFSKKELEKKFKRIV